MISGVRIGGVRRANTEVALLGLDVFCITELLTPRFVGISICVAMCFVAYLLSHAIVRLAALTLSSKISFWVNSSIEEPEKVWCTCTVACLM